MFTEQDHRKAVELYEKFRDEEWWPDIMWQPDGGWCMHHFEFGWIGMGRNHALSAIAWAMVERLKANVMLGPGASIYSSDGKFVSRINWQVTVGATTHGDDTLFLALAAAIENTHKEA
jgi:hypothetical protein